MSEQKSEQIKIEQMKTNYTIPKVCPSDKDMSKPWFVYFRWTDQITGKRVAFRFKAGLNTILNKRERVEEANALCYAVTQRLKAGWNPINNIVDNQQKTLIECFKQVVDTKRLSLRKGSIKSYDYVLRTFIDWMGTCKYLSLYPQNFTSLMGRSYFDYLLIKKKYVGKTHNNHLSILCNLFNALVEREIITKNPLSVIKELPVEDGKNFPYSKDEQSLIKSYLYNNNRRLYYAIQFVYYCFIRRTELIKLKVGDIDWTNMSITIPSSASKNRKQESVTIPKAFEKILFEMGLDLAPKDFFIFGHRFKTCEKQILKPDSLTQSHRKALDCLKIGSEKGFYSWKHTGVCELYNATKDPYLVMQQCRHSDISITMIYLRSLGLTVNERIREAVYNF